MIETSKIRMPPEMLPSGSRLLRAVCSMGEHKVRHYSHLSPPAFWLLYSGFFVPSQTEYPQLNPMMYYRQSYIDDIAMIRNFIPTDAVACSNLIHACIKTDRTIPADLKDAMIRAESPYSMIERSRLFYMAVYESDDRISGVIGLDMNEIRILCVSPGHQRRGIGFALLNHAVDMVPGALFTDISVYAVPGAVAFYKAAGFEEKGPAVFSFAGDPLQTVFMTRSIR